MCGFSCSANCAHCNYNIPLEMRDTGNEAGLTLQYVLEIIWMVYPPAATGLDPQKRYLWMKPVAHDDDVDVAFMGMYLGVHGYIPGG